MRVNFCVKEQGVLFQEQIGAPVVDFRMNRVLVIPQSNDPDCEVRDWKTAWKEVAADWMAVGKVAAIATTTAAVLSPLFAVPDAVFAMAPETGVSDIDAFNHVYDAVMRGFDAGVVLVIVFSGAVWATGHRPLAMQILIGVSCGYLLARHSRDIRDFLKTI